MWRVVFEPGKLVAVSRRNGKTVLTRQIKTAGKPERIILTADRKTITKEMDDLSFITATIVDDAGNPVPRANNLVKFSVNPEGRVIATDNGSETSLESFQDKDRKTFNGRCLAIVRSNGNSGSLNITATSEGLVPGHIHIDVK